MKKNTHLKLYKKFIISTKGSIYITKVLVNSKIFCYTPDCLSTFT